MSAETLRQALGQAVRELSDLGVDLREVERRIAQVRIKLNEAAQAHDRGGPHDPRD